MSCLPCWRLGPAPPSPKSQPELCRLSVKAELRLKSCWTLLTVFLHRSPAPETVW